MLIYPPMGSICAANAARGKSAHVLPHCDPHENPIAGGEDVGFVSGNEERTRAVPHLQGCSFSAAVGT